MSSSDFDDSDDFFDDSDLDSWSVALVLGLVIGTRSTSDDITWEGRTGVEVDEYNDSYTGLTAPTAEPTAAPTETPTAEPTAAPTETPTAAPTATELEGKWREEIEKWKVA